ncbi:hypothetical protein [Herbaspirillum sp. YR522]|uniref:hypothetical protein n=1 Tax=Herbaspirillum sp. YR522 TaxID=1144342 RepID=UPI00026FA288|nr:hypothetical protein [Herbaspirillum sp. YR522]EJN06442.1 hypothetical protein PMI40_02228 [Herbaspirillum sp. YR522]
MGRTTFFEEGGYFLFCTATPLKNGKWQSSVLFERMADHAHEMVRGIRHIIRGAEFELESDAVAQAYQFGLDLIRRDAVALD